MKRKVLLGLCLVLFLPMLSFAAAEKFIPGKDYEVLATPVPNAQAGKVQVIEFFSYGCPWCFRLEPTVEKWLKTKPKYVVFTRVPVIFERGWDVYARAYYTAHALNIEDKITPAMFKAIHDDRERLHSSSSLKKLFMKYGVDEKSFNGLFQYSPAIDLKVSEAPKLMKKYSVLAVPTMIVSGKYKVNMEFARGDNARFLAILNYLIQKSRKG